MTTAKNQPQVGAPLAIWIGPAVLVAMGLGSGWVGAFVAARMKTRPTMRQTISYWGSPLDPARGWPIGGLSAAAAILVLAIAFGMITWSRWIRHSSAKRRGMASTTDLKPYTAKAVEARAGVLRPGLSGDVRATQVSISLGRSHTGQEILSSIEDVIVVIGPQRSGKSARVVAPTVITWDGPAIVTGTRPDVITWTLQQRNWVGECALFDPDPEATVTGVPLLRWSPLQGCTNDMTALLRATSLLDGRGEAQGNDVFWREDARRLLSCYLMAGAYGNRTMSEVRNWANQPDSLEPVDILRANDQGGWAEELANAISKNDRYRDGVWGNVNQALFPFLLRGVRERCDIRADDPDQFSPTDFLRGSSTLYMLGSPNEQKAIAALNVAIIDEITECARREARELGRLDPPLLLALDEVANTAPLPKLPQLLSTGGGSGICTMPVFQSVGQARETWGRDLGQSMVTDLANMLIILGGLGNADDLRDLSQILGERDEETRSVSTRSQRSAISMFSHDVSTSTRLRPVMDPSEIRELKSRERGEALLVPRAAKPVRTTLPGYWELKPSHSLPQAERPRLAH